MTTLPSLWLGYLVTSFLGNASILLRRSVCLPGHPGGRLPPVPHARVLFALVHVHAVPCVRVVALFSPARVPDVLIWQPRRRGPMCDPASPFGSHGPIVGEAEGANLCIQL
jgi:hypothetical protein